MSSKNDKFWYSLLKVKNSDAARIVNKFLFKWKKEEFVKIQKGRNNKFYKTFAI